jgi:hypothetical protein
MQSLPPPTPGIYPGGGQASLLRANEQTYLFQQTLLTAGQSAASNGSNPSASIAVQLERIKTSSYPNGVSVSIWFTNSSSASSAPGAFEVDIQTADLDLDSQYVSLSKVTTGLNANNVTRVELTAFWAKFLRLNVITLTNPVYLNALVSR